MTIEKTQNRRDLRAELESYDGTHPETWNPDPDDILEGILVRYEEVDAGHGLTRIAVIDDQETGKLRSVWLGPKVLGSEFEKHRPRPGEHIAIKRFSDHTKGYKLYKLVVDREIADEPPVLDGFGASGNSGADGNGELPETDAPF